MNANAMSLKAKIRNMAKDKNISAQVILQNYMFERLLERISVSDYKNKFILKGGILISALVGIDTRTTMDLDATIKFFKLTENNIISALNEICAINLDDGVGFSVLGIEPIRKDDDYGGFRAGIEALYDTIITPLSVDISTGDVITPHEVLFSFKCMFDAQKHIDLWAYSIETVLAEKVETILRRGVFNTRPRDYYDVFILSKTQKYDDKTFFNALTATAKHRKSEELISKAGEILGTIEKDAGLIRIWEKYRKEYRYASDISFDNAIQALRELLKL